MANIRQRATKPELVVAGIVHALGQRYRKENRDLRGSPDLANRARRWAIFVHGCFWHRHAGCRLATTPKRNAEFWLAKFARNLERDAVANTELAASGYRVCVIWECETRDVGRLAPRMKKWFEDILTRGEPCGRSRDARALRR